MLVEAARSDPPMSVMPPRSLLHSAADVEPILALLRDAMARPDDAAVAAAIRELPHRLLAELVALAECGRRGIGRTIADVEELLRFGIIDARTEQLAQRLFQADICRSSWRGSTVSPISDGPTPNAPSKAMSDLRERDTSPMPCGAQTEGNREPDE